MASATTISTLLVRLTGDVSDFQSKMSSATGTVDKVGKTMQRVGTVMTASVTAPMMALGTGAAKAAVDFESGFAGVMKTVDGLGSSTQELTSLGEQLRGEFRELATTMPIAQSEILAVGEAAGQLGIETDNIIGFTETMAKLGVTTNLSAEQAAMSLAKFANITGMAQTEFDELGSVIVELGNNMATTEADIVAMGQRLAAAGTTVGMTEAEIMALAATMSSLGMEAQAGGTAVSRVMIDMANAVADGGAKLEQFAEVAGMTAEQFATLFEEDAVGAIDAFATGLGRIQEEGGNVFATLEDLEMGEIRVRDAMLRMAGAGELTSNAIGMANKAWAENSALADEAAKRFETTASKMQVLKNRITDVAVSFGDILLPKIIAVMDKLLAFAERIGEMDAKTQNLVVTLGAVAAAIGPVTVVLGTFISSVSTIAGVIGPLIGSIGGLSTAALGAESALAAMGGGAAAAGAGFTAMLGPIAAVGAAIAGLTLALRAHHQMMEDTAPRRELIATLREESEAYENATAAGKAHAGALARSVEASEEAASASRELTAASDLSAGQMNDYAEMTRNSANAVDGLRGALGEVPSTAGPAAGALNSVADAASNVEYNAGEVARSFGEMDWGDWRQQAWQMALSLGLNSAELTTLAKKLGIATDEEIAATIQAYKLAEGLAEGTINVGEFAGGMGGLAYEMEGAAAVERDLNKLVRDTGDAAEGASGKVDDLAGSAGNAAGQMDDAYHSARNLKGAIDGLPDRKDISININVHKPADVGDWFNLQSPTFVFETALKNLVEYARAHVVDVKLNLPTDKIKNFTDAIKTLNDAFSSLADLGTTLSGLGGALDDLGTAAVYGSPTGAFGKITFVLERLAEWARMLQGVITDIAARMPKVKEKTQEAVAATADVVSAMDDLVSALIDFGAVLGRVSGTLDDIGIAFSYDPRASLRTHDYSDAFNEIASTLKRLRDWVQELEPLLISIANDLSGMGEETSALIETVGDNIDSMSGLIKALTGFGDVLSGIQGALDDIGHAFEIDFDAWKQGGLRTKDYSDTFNEIASTLKRLRDWALAMEPLLSGIAQDLPVFTEEESKVFAAVTDAVDALDGLMGALLSFAETFGKVAENEVDLVAATVVFENIHEDLKAALRTAWNSLTDLIDLLDDWNEDAGTSVLAKKVEALSQALSAAFGPLNDAVGLLEKLASDELPSLGVGFIRLESYLPSLKSTMKMAYDALKGLLTGDDAILVDFTEDEGVWEIGRKMDVLASAIQSAFGPLDDAINLLSTLASEELPSLGVGFIRLESYLPTLKATMRNAYDALEGLLTGEDAIVVEFTEDEEGNSFWALGDQMAALSDAVQSAFGPLGDAVGLLSTLGDDELPSLSAGFIVLENSLSDLEDTMQMAFDALEGMLDGIVVEFTEDEGIWLIGEQMKALSDAIQSAFGPIGNAVSLLKTLADDELPDLAAGFAEFELSLSYLESTMQYAFDALEGLLGDDGIVIEFTEDEGIWLLGEQMGVLASAISAAFGPLGNAVSFLSQLASDELPDLTIGFERMQRVLRALKGAMRNAYDMLRGLLEDPDGILVTFTEEGAWLLGDKIDALSKAIQSAFGPISGAVDLLSTLAEHRLQDLREAFGKLGAMLPSLRATARMAYEMMRDLAEQELTDWEEGASELADKTVAMGDAVSSAFGGINSAIGALSGLIDLMWAMGTIAGTEHLEAADFEGLIIGVNMLMEVLHYSMQRLKAATRGLDLETLEGVGESLKIVGDGLKAMADGMQAMVDLVAPTVEGTESVADGIDKAGEALDGALTLMADILINPPWGDTTWYDEGWNLGVSLAQGLTDSGRLAIGAAEVVAGEISARMPHSPAEKGPLSEPINWNFLSDGLAETMGYIRAQMSLPDLSVAGAGASGNRYYDMTFNYPPGTELDLKRQMELIELTDRYKR